MKKWFLAGAVVACVLITGCAGSHEDEATHQPPLGTKKPPLPPSLPPNLKNTPCLKKRPRPSP
ncbi:hypothetical protein NHP21005_05570 [Helicobacter sp. NHP21005]|nr:hypothetical protein NHP21005_05570 [Helicobacter sp. NHP21005]